METRILMISDLHLCHVDWHGMTSEARMAIMAENVNAYTAEHPTDAILMLGDFSLDFWQWQIGGSYLADPPVSNTKRFVDEFVSRLQVPCYLIPGNHEQYGNETWKAITGMDRRFACKVGDLRVLMLDTFAGNLDPTEHSDGTYTGPDADYIKAQLGDDPTPMILCAHNFEPYADSKEAQEIIANDPRILALFSGHVHHSLVEDYHGKVHARDGHFSYAAWNKIEEYMWGFREVIYDGKTLKSRYITPANTITTDSGIYHHKGGEQDAFEIDVAGNK